MKATLRKTLHSSHISPKDRGYTMHSPPLERVLLEERRGIVTSSSTKVSDFDITGESTWEARLFLSDADIANQRPLRFQNLVEILATRAAARK